MISLTLVFSIITSITTMIFGFHYVFKSSCCSTSVNVNENEIDVEVDDKNGNKIIDLEIHRNNIKE